MPVPVCLSACLQAYLQNYMSNLAGTSWHTLLYAGNDTVPISVWRGGSVDSGVV